jgi:signal transduction histidine kinase
LFLTHRDRLSHLEPVINRFLIYYLSLSLLLGLYLILAVGANHFTAADLAFSATNIWISAGLLLCFPFVYGLLQRLIDWLLYGGEIDYMLLLTQFSEALSLTLDQATLTRLLVHDLVSALYLQGGILFLRQSDDQFMLADATGFDLAADVFHQPWPRCPVLSRLETEGNPILTFRLRQMLADAALGRISQALFALPGVAFWMPLISNGVLQGVLLLSSRLSGDHLSARDQSILTALSRQAGIAAYNVLLVEQVVQGQHDLNLAHQKLLIGREEERRRLAHELHAGPVQQLLGLSYQIVTLYRQASRDKPLNPQSLGEVRSHLLDIVGQLRQMISGLQPTGLEELGLFAALEGYIARLKRTHTEHLPAIDYDLKGDGACLPGVVTICLFRVVQEALRNTLKHAKASRITIRLEVSDDRAYLRFQDNGQGFQVPSQLSSLTRQDHFGLVSMLEQVSWVGGDFAIQSQPHIGTKLTVSIPLLIQTSAREDLVESEEDHV